MAPKALSQIAITAAKPTHQRREVPDGKIGGLYLVIQPSGAKSWAFRYRAAGRPKKLTIGPYPTIDLAAARRLAGKAMTVVAEGGDPAAKKQAVRAAEKAKAQEETFTVGKVVDMFIARHVRPNTRITSATEVERLLNKEVVPFWGNRPLSSIGRADVHARLDQIIDRGVAVMANRFLAVFRKMCAWALDRGIIDRNPCESVRAPTPEISRDRVLADDELRHVWNASGGIGWPFGSVVRLLILTGQRRGEVTAMLWSEVDMEKRTWTIPKERAKNGVEHVVPLSSQAVDVLRSLPTIVSKSGLVFTMTTVTPVSGHSRAKSRLDDAIAKVADKPLPAFVLHDLRRTVASGMARLGVNLPVVEKVLNHISGSFAGIVGVYQRHSFADEKRAALELWGRHVEGVVHGRSANVVELAEARAS